MANIRKLPNGRWEVTVYIGRDQNGKILRRYARAYSEREAKQIARDLENEIASKNITRVSMMKMTDWMETWFEITRPLIAPTTRKAYRLYIEKHFTPAFGDIRVCDLTDLHIKAYIANKLTVDELSPTTVRKHFYTLHKILFDALKYNSPMIGMKPPAPATFIPAVPKKEEFEQIRVAFAELCNFSAGYNSTFFS